MDAQRITVRIARGRVLLVALVMAACADGTALGPGSVLSSVGEAPAAATPPQGLHNESPAELPFRLSGEASLLSQTLAPGFGPPTFGTSTFAGRCSAEADFVIEFAIEAEAAHLGRLAATAGHCTILNFQTGTGTEIDGVTVFTAANGDELWGSYDGSFAPGQGFTENYEFTGGTGRFAGASGGGTGTGVCNLQTGTCILEIEGVIATG